MFNNDREYLNYPPGTREEEENGELKGNNVGRGNVVLLNPFLFFLLFAFPRHCRGPR